MTVCAQKTSSLHNPADYSSSSDLQDQGNTVRDALLYIFVFSIESGMVGLRFLCLAFASLQLLDLDRSEGIMDLGPKPMIFGLCVYQNERMDYFPLSLSPASSRIRYISISASPPVSNVFVSDSNLPLPSI